MFFFNVTFVMTLNQSSKSNFYFWKMVQVLKSFIMLQDQTDTSCVLSKYKIMSYF